ncbi:MAG: hypothetical protein LBI82_04390 [Dysgonamonadaceae bacterium]|jgi:hypothetical protein|nr:hypothetical protein [Dysgonamonadaceae bacterium]
MTNKQRYEIFCNERPEIPFFMQAWWLDAVCTPEDKQWDVLLCEENGKIIGVMSYHLLKKWGLKIIVQPQLTQYTGVWIDYPKDDKLHKRYSLEKQVMDNLIDQLEKLKVSFYEQNFHYSFTNWQPFYWRGFQQTTRYTYILKNIVDLEIIYNGIHKKIKQHIQKGEEEFAVYNQLTPEEFYQFHKSSLQAKKRKIIYSERIFMSIYQAAISRNQGKIIAIRDKKNELLSAVFFVWDKDSAYNLIVAKAPLENAHFISDYMTWEVIKYVSKKTQNYDFEGSMIEGVARKNQYFGAEQQPYFCISKTNSYIFDLLLKLKIRKKEDSKK